MKVGDAIQFPPLPGAKGGPIREPIGEKYFQRRSDEELIKSLIGKTFIVKDHIDGTAILEIKE